MDSLGLILWFALRPDFIKGNFNLHDVESVCPVLLHLN